MSLSPSRRFHVVSLQVPFPPDYGGVIDIYYKLKALKKMGYETWLHTFQYDRSRAEQLNEVAARVSYYPRHRSVIRQLSHIPYIVLLRAGRGYFGVCVKGGKQRHRDLRVSRREITAVALGDR